MKGFCYHSRYGPMMHAILKFMPRLWSRAEDMAAHALSRYGHQAAECGQPDAADFDSHDISMLIKGWHASRISSPASLTAATPTYAAFAILKLAQI